MEARAYHYRITDGFQLSFFIILLAKESTIKQAFSMYNYSKKHEIKVPFRKRETSSASSVHIWYDIFKLQLFQA